MYRVTITHESGRKDVTLARAVTPDLAVFAAQADGPAEGQPINARPVALRLLMGDEPTHEEVLWLNPQKLAQVAIAEVADPLPGAVGSPLMKDTERPPAWATSTAWRLLRLHTTDAIWNEWWAESLSPHHSSTGRKIAELGDDCAVCLAVRLDLAQQDEDWQTGTFRVPTGRGG